MAWNRNSQVTDLLAWHGHDRGGVRTPFRGNNPLRTEPIKTSLLRRMRGLAQQIAAGTEAVPRWIFLVGGPGNGKSETVQDFLASLDDQLGLQGRLVRQLQEAFAPSPLSPRRVEVRVDALAPVTSTVSSRIGRIVVLQDATATEDPLGDAAQQLVQDLADLLTTPETPTPLFVVCANRGLLSRAVKWASRDWGPDEPVTARLLDIMRASGLGMEALVRPEQRPSCWPIQTDPRFACWPLDFESLLLPVSGGPAPAEQIIESAVSTQAWEVPGRCADCDAARYCPFRQNASWLRSQPERTNLLRILRRGELATGQRWNFRDTFSLAAEIMVGQWDDFARMDHPCQWVHSQVQLLVRNDSSPERLSAAWAMSRRLYPHALFSTCWHEEEAEKNLDLLDGTNHELSKTAVEVLTGTKSGSAKPIRDRLVADYSQLDPAVYTPRQRDHALRLLEDEYSQSLELGNATPRVPRLSLAEDTFLALLEDAEQEWDWELLGRAANQARSTVSLIRRLATELVKRSIGARLGFHANETYLSGYETAVRDLAQLNAITTDLQLLLGSERFRFNLVESFGQPSVDEDRLVMLTSSLPGIRAYPAPTESEVAPGHDVPFFMIRATEYPIPITFDFYFALRLRKEGCASSSLPASVRAAVDRVRHRTAGQLARDIAILADRSTEIALPGKGYIRLIDETADPTFSIT